MYPVSYAAGSATSSSAASSSSSCRIPEEGCLSKPLVDQLNHLLFSFTSEKPSSEFDLLELLTSGLSQILEKKESVKAAVFEQTLQTVNAQVERLDFDECLENKTLYQLAILKAQLEHLLKPQASSLLLESDGKLIPFNSTNHENLLSLPPNFISLNLKAFYEEEEALDEVSKSLFLYYALKNPSDFRFPNLETLFIFFRWAQYIEDKPLKQLCEQSILKIADKYQKVIDNPKLFNPNKIVSKMITLVELATDFCQGRELQFLRQSQKDWLYSLIQSVHTYKTTEQFFQLEGFNKVLKHEIDSSKQFLFAPEQQKKFLQGVRYITRLAEELGLLFLETPFEDCSLILHWIEKGCPESEEWLEALGKAEDCYLSGDFSLNVLKKVLKACPNLSSLRVEQIDFNPEDLLRLILETKHPLKNLFYLSTWESHSSYNSLPDIPSLFSEFQTFLPYSSVFFQSPLTGENLLSFACSRPDEDARAKMQTDLEELKPYFPGVLTL